MSEPRRADVPPPPVAADRDGHIEALLVDGLDHYFAGRYDEAIHLWTRVLFLDRAHARARAYIDRARSAQAERDRRADEMLHEMGQSLEEGDTARARQLLTEVVDAAGDDERAAGLRLRLERIERAGMPGAAVSGHVAAVVDAVPLRTGMPRRWPLVAGGLALMLAAVAVVAGLIETEWMGLGRPAVSPIMAEPVETAVVPSGAEVALIRAETLFARGRLAEALRVLDRADLDAVDREAADRLRVRIERHLFALAGDAAPAADLAEDAAP